MQDSNKTYKCIRKSSVKNKLSVSIGTVTGVILLQLGQHWNTMTDTLGPYMYIEWMSNENAKYCREKSAQLILEVTTEDLSKAIRTTFQSNIILSRTYGSTHGQQKEKFCHVFNSFGFIADFHFKRSCKYIDMEYSRNFK